MQLMRPTGYAGIVVNKPWGYEYLLHDSGQMAAWILYLRAGASTSVHCHRHKATSLVVLSGEVVTSTLSQAERLRALDSRAIGRSVYHATRAISAAGAFLCWNWRRHRARKTSSGCATTTAASRPATRMRRTIRPISAATHTCAGRSSARPGAPAPRQAPARVPAGLRQSGGVVLRRPGRRGRPTGAQQRAGPTAVRAHGLLGQRRHRAADHRSC
jgi:mannose-6-phosphate isomerase-like protein (cupin superfamily)